MATKNHNRVGIPKEDKIMYTIIYIAMGLLLVTVLYPLIYVVSSSFSSGLAVSSGKVLLWPVDPSVTGYKIIFSYKLVWSGYFNTILVTVVATTINVVLTICAAYPLSRRDFIGRNFYMTLFMITMFFSGGLIPNYILMSRLNLTNTRWSVILAGAISVTNMIIMRTYFINSIPSDLFDAARIDGINDWGYLFRIVLPLSRAIMAVLILYYAVAHWNSYFNAMLYIRDRDLYPLQIVLRDILNVSKIDLSQITDAEVLAQMTGAADLIKFALIVVSAVPILSAYPFVQKYFEKGVMIGSVKG